MGYELSYCDANIAPENIPHVGYKTDHVPDGGSTCSHTAGSSGDCTDDHARANWLNVASRIDAGSTIGCSTGWPSGASSGPTTRTARRCSRTLCATRSCC